MKPNASLRPTSRLASISPELAVALDAFAAGGACWAALHLFLNLLVSLGGGPREQMPAGRYALALLLALFVGGAVAAHSANLDRSPGEARRKRNVILFTGLLAALCESVPAWLATLVALYGVPMMWVHEAHAPGSLAALPSYRALSILTFTGLCLMLIGPIAPGILMVQMARAMDARERPMHRLLRHGHWLFLAPYLLFYILLLVLVPYLGDIRDPGFATPREALVDFLDRYEIESIRIEEEGRCPDRSGGERFCFLVIHREDAITRFRIRKVGDGWEYSGSEGRYTRDTLPPAADR